ncbi:hypothetical protein [Bacteroides sp. 519]|uniref:hypothetical protein n=1 Tax=Bacteroides sp. 519 TaxID=2302937 RepID=UPI0013D0CFFF|nr:hypothetical protein [Bacteroides sp. 519]
MKRLRDDFVTFIYRFRNNENKLLLELTYAPIDYLYYRADKEEDIYLTLTQMESVTKKTLPLLLADNIYVIDMKAERPAILEYTIQFMDKNSNKRIQEIALIDYIRESGSLSKLRDYNVVFRYKVLDANKELIDAFEINPENYKSFEW